MTVFEFWLPKTYFRENRCFCREKQPFWRQIQPKCMQNAAKNMWFVAWKCVFPIDNDQIWSFKHFLKYRLFRPFSTIYRPLWAITVITVICSREAFWQPIIFDFLRAYINSASLKAVSVDSSATIYVGLVELLRFQTFPKSSKTQLFAFFMFFSGIHACSWNHAEWPFLTRKIAVLPHLLRISMTDEVFIG